MSEPIVSTNAREIRYIYQTPASTTISIETMGNHGLTVLDTVSVRADGHDGYTKRAHKANGDDWPIAVIDDKTIVLQGSVFVADSHFRSGFLYTGNLTLDACQPLQELVDIGEEDGGHFRISLPEGILAMLVKSGPTHLLGGRTSCTIEGAGKFSTMLVSGDFTSGHMLFWYDQVNVTLRDLAFFGNRQYQGIGGYHLTRFGSAAGDTTGNVEVLRCRYLASAGYSIGFQSDGSFRYILIDGCTFLGADSDIHDVKNRSNLGGNSTCTNSSFIDGGLFVQGVDHNGKLLGANPITTDSGTPTSINVAHSGQIFAVGITVTLVSTNQSGSFNGLDLTVPLAGVITARGAGGYTLDISGSGQSANASGSGGGSAVIAYGGMYSQGDAYLDTRGNYWTCSNLHFEGDFQSRDAVRARKGHIYAAGSGADKSTFTNITIVHTGPLPQKGKGIDLMAPDCAVSNVTGTNLDRVVSVSSNVKGGTVTSVIGHSCNHVVFNDGENMTFVGCEGKDSKAASFYNDGGLAEDSGELDTNPFTTTPGSDIVEVRHDLHAHIAGNQVTYTDAAFGNNVDMNGLFTVVTVLDANRYTVQATTTADAPGAMGGENVSFEWSGSSHLARLTKFIGCTSIASVLGFGFSAKSRDVLVTACSSYQDTTPYSDLGLRTKWKNNTGDLPSLEEVTDLPLDGTPLTLTTADSGRLFYLPTTATATAVVYLPAGVANNRGMRFPFANGSGTYGIEVRLQGTGNIRLGSTTSTVGLSCAAAGDTIDLVFREVNQQRWMATSNIGTWSAI